MQSIIIQPEKMFQAFADRTRLRIVHLLAETKEEMCLCEFTESLAEPQYKLSRHLKILREAGLLAAKKEGRWVYHRLITGIPHLDILWSMIRSLPDIDGIYAKDLKCFENHLREKGRCSHA